MSFNYLNDILRSGVAETAILIKAPYENNEFGDPVYNLDEKDEYTFKTFVDNLNRAENEQEAGDYIEGDIRFYVSPEVDIEFNNGDFIKYKGDYFNITSTMQKNVGSQAGHKEVIAENAEILDDYVQQ